MTAPYVLSDGTRTIEELTVDGRFTRWDSAGNVIEQTTGHPVDVPDTTPVPTVDDLTAQIVTLTATVDQLLAALGGGAP